MLKPVIISLCLLPLTLTTQACGQSVEAIEKSNTAPVTVKAVVPKSAPMTVEEIRAEQVKLEAQIAEIRAKRDLERADKIALLKLTNVLIALNKVEIDYQNAIIQKQKGQMAREFAEIREQIQDWFIFCSSEHNMIEYLWHLKIENVLNRTSKHNR